jgi:hypothetical protein
MKGEKQSKMSSSNNNNAEEAKELNGPVVVRYHAILRDPQFYNTRLQMFQELEYITFCALQTPLSTQAIRYFTEENPRAPILIVTPDGTIGLKKDRTAALYNTSYRHNLLPLRIESRLLRGVPLQQIDMWENNIRERNAQLDNDPDIAIPRFEDSGLPLIDVWVGICSYDRCTIIADILSSELAVLHFFDVLSGREFFNPQVKRSHSVATFGARFCWNYECQVCHQFIRVPRGLYGVGEKVNPETAHARYEIREINDMLDVLDESSSALMRTAQLSDLAYLSSNSDLMKKLMAEEEAKVEEENRL